MDPISQAAVGAAASMTGAIASTRNLSKNRPTSEQQKSTLKHAAIIGALAGMAPDLDVLIRSSTDPLLTLEYHRQFTHSLFFVPFGALLCAAVFYLLWGRRCQLRFISVYLWSVPGFGSHGLLDACTSYGTQLLWPFSDLRVAWYMISVVDPLFTLPLVVLLLLTIRKNSRALLGAGLLWAGIYLSAGWLQHERAHRLGQALADSRNHQPSRLIAKPSFGNIAAWKTLYEYNDRYYIDAVKPGWPGTKVWEGDSVQKLDLKTQFAWLQPDSQLARDVERFRHFSSDYLATAPSSPNTIVDIRYSILPQEATGLWGIALNPSAEKDEHVDYIVSRERSEGSLKTLLSMIFF